MAVKVLGSAEVSANSPFEARGLLEDGRQKLPSNGRSRSTGRTASTSGLSGNKMQSALHFRSVGFVVFFLLRNHISSDVFCSASAAGEQHLRRSPQSGFTDVLRQHNGSSLLATLGREAAQGVRLTPEEASLALAGSWNPAESKQSYVATPATARGTLRGTDSEEMAKAESTPLYGRLGDTLVAARGVADKARQQLSQFWGLQDGGSNLLQWWTKNGTAAVRAAITSLFGKGTPSPDDATVKEMGALLAALQQQQQQHSARVTGVASGAPATENAAATPGSGRKTLQGGLEGNHLGMLIFPEQPYPRRAVPGGTPAALAGFAAARDENTPRDLPPPAFQELDPSGAEKEHLLWTLSQRGGGPPILSLLSGDSGSRVMGDILQTVAGAFDIGGASRNEALGQNDLSSLLPYGLPSMRFSALSILTEGDTLKNWTSLVKMHKQYGQADYMSAAALDVMEKLAVVLACAYKTAKTLLGEHQAVSLIRAAIRQNASFQQQIYSAVRRYMEGGEPAEDAAQPADGSTPRKKGPMDVEARLLHELLKRIVHMPVTFFHQLSQKHRKTLDHWGVDAGELQNTVKEALFLKFPPTEGETHA